MMDTRRSFSRTPRPALFEAEYQEMETCEVTRLHDIVRTSVEIFTLRPVQRTPPDLPGPRPPPASAPRASATRAAEEPTRRDCAIARVRPVFCCAWVRSAPRGARVRFSAALGFVWSSTAPGLVPRRARLPQVLRCARVRLVFDYAWVGSTPSGSPLRSGSFGFPLRSVRVVSHPRSGSLGFPLRSGFVWVSTLLGFIRLYGPLGFVWIRAATPAAAIVATQLAATNELASARAERPSAAHDHPQIRGKQTRQLTRS
jgi:hypothetical protein